MFVIGRGAEFATAREIALKLLETCRIAAEPLTATDLAHGPVAALDPLFPVWAIASRRRRRCRPCRRRPSAIHAMGATLVASGTPRPSGSTAPRTVCPVPTPRAALLSPLLSVVPGQLFASALSPRPRARPRRAARAQQGHARRVGRSPQTAGERPAARTIARNRSTGNPGPGSQ